MQHSGGGIRLGGRDFLLRNFVNQIVKFRIDQRAVKIGERPADQTLKNRGECAGSNGFPVAERAIGRFVPNIPHGEYQAHDRDEKTADHADALTGIEPGNVVVVTEEVLRQSNQGARHRHRCTKEKRGLHPPMLHRPEGDGDTADGTKCGRKYKAAPAISGGAARVGIPKRMPGMDLDFWKNQAASG